MEKKQPLVVIRNSDFIKCPYMLVEPAAAHKVLFLSWTKDCLDAWDVTEALISKDFTPKDPQNPIPEAKKFKETALLLGATPEAIRLLGTLIPLTRKEMNEMAEKLKAKGDAAALKSAAKSTPVAGKNTAAKKRGNTEALAKARAARSQGPDLRKIRPLIKVKDFKARAGTFRHQMLSDAVSSKTVQEFRGRNSKYDAGCLKFAIDSGHIAVG